MKKVVIFVLINTLFILPCFAIEEKNSFEKIFTKKEAKFDDGFINELSGEIRYKGRLEINDCDNDTHAKYPFDITAAIESKFSDNKYRFYTSYEFTRDIKNADNDFTEKFSNLYIERNFNNKNKIRIGTRRAPIGYEGSISSYLIPFARRAQISRTIGNAVSTGVSFIGENEFLEYDIGGYTSTRFTQGFDDGMDFTGRIGIKPIKDKNLKIYIGTDTGHKSKTYGAHFASINYENEKFLFSGEYAYANGYNGRQFSTNESQGAFLTAGWNITPKVQFLVRYDYFDPDINSNNNERVEYTAGINYFVFKERLRFALNYIFSNEKNSKKDGHGIYFLTQFYI